MKNIEIAPPIAAGIPACAIHSFLDRLENYQINMHSILIMRHSKLVAEGYYAPYQASTLHRMFSVCKTMNALAMGLLEEEEKIGLDDTIASYFPDKIPDDVHPWITEMTIRNLLMMRTCHTSTTYKRDLQKDWVESFFITEPTHKPGTVFHYDTSASHVLCALVERLTEKSMLTYLKEKMLNKMGWSEDSYVLKNDFGDSQGGSGLMATPRDLLLLGKLLLQNGSWNGEQLISASYIQQMTSCLTPNAITGSVLSETQGYGYQLWRTRHNGFVCYGMGGQLAVCLPDKDMILVTTADTQGVGGGNDMIYNSFYEEILTKLDTKPNDMKQESILTASLQERLHALSLTPVEKWCTTANNRLSHTSFLDPYSVADKINEKSYCLSDNSGGFTSISLFLAKRQGKLTFTLQGMSYEICFGLENCLTGTFPVYNMKCASSGMWLSENTFYIKSHLIDTSIGSVQIELVFGEKDVTAYMKKIEETMFHEFSGHLYGKIC